MTCLDVYFAKESGYLSTDVDAEVEAVNWLSWELWFDKSWAGNSTSVWFKIFHDTYFKYRDAKQLYR